MADHIDVALVGADTPAGQAFLEVLADVPLAISNFYPLSDDEDASTIELRSHVLPVLDVDGFNWGSVQAAVFVGNAALAGQYAAQAAEAGAIVLDLTGGATETSHKPARGKVTVMPHAVSSMIAAALDALKPLGPAEFVAATAMLSASEDGKNGIEAISMQTRQIFAQQELELAGYAKRLAFNLLPAQEIEARVRREVGATGRKMDGLMLVRAPVFFGHAVSLAVRLSAPQTLEAVEQALQASPALFVRPAGEANMVTPQDVVGADKVWVNAPVLAEDGQTVNLWLVADNARLPARTAALLLALL